MGPQGLAGEGAATDTTTVSGELAFSVFAAVAEIERARISERTIGAFVAARPREGERPCTRTAAKAYLGMAATRTAGVRER
ncbi:MULTISPECIES: recombinase family protein [Cryobacterium]|uniref:recombinase family protein n=1 Tax=Cryobacterium TaxID=69578 RepID=UPI001F5406F6|nr:MULTISPECIES: recombinase family protein [Cryobacterium]